MLLALKLASIIISIWIKAIQFSIVFSVYDLKSEYALFCAYDLVMARVFINCYEDNDAITVSWLSVFL